MVSFFYFVSCICAPPNTEKVKEQHLARKCRPRQSQTSNVPKWDSLVEQFLFLFLNYKNRLYSTTYSETMRESKGSAIEGSTLSPKIALNSKKLRKRWILKNDKLCLKKKNCSIPRPLSFVVKKKHRAKGKGSWE